MKIYTKTGDKGKTSLFDGTRVYKNNPRVEAYGTIDELNSVIGIVVTQVQSSKFKVQSKSGKFKATLTTIQNMLFEIGSCLANPKVDRDTRLTNQLTAQTRELEEYIDELTEQLPPLTHFILPGGGTVGAFLQLARTVSRRVERTVVGLSQQEAVDAAILIYINRLSDLFYTMSRYANFTEGKKEIIWSQKGQESHRGQKKTRKMD